MASGIFAVLDDVAALMDDVAVASKIATQKTAGILGDDLAVNAEKATGFLSSRELPVLWSISKGSLINKAIIVPVALLLSAFFPIAIKVALVLGGIFLAYEAAEKVIEFLFHRAKKGHEVIEHREANDPNAEKAKIKSAITTDFILSVEIVIIALGSVIDESLPIQIITVTLVSLLATGGVYGFVAIIVRMDDAGFKLIKRSDDKGLLSKLGHGLVKLLPLIIKFFGIVGTLALILVSGGIFVHNIGPLHHVLPHLPLTIKEALMGLAAGFIAVGVVFAVKKLFSLFRPQA
jgi:uncharacterized protein